MATYPALLTLRDSTEERDGGVIPARATNGALRVRVMYPADKRAFEVRHLLTSAEDCTLALPVPQARPEKHRRRKAVAVEVVAAAAAALAKRD